VYDRYALREGSFFPGPAVVEERESTVYLGADANATVTACGDLKVTLCSAGADNRSKAKKSEKRNAKATT